MGPGGLRAGTTSTLSSAGGRLLVAVRPGGSRCAQDESAGDECAACGGPLAPLLGAAQCPLRLDEVLEHEAGPHDGPHPVADGAVVLDVDGAALAGIALIVVGVVVLNLFSKAVPH